MKRLFHFFSLSSCSPVASRARHGSLATSGLCVRSRRRSAPAAVLVGAGDISQLDEPVRAKPGEAY